MEYKRIVAVTSLPGLYELVSSKTDGAILRSLNDNSTRFVSSRVHNLSHLESIEVYTTGENVNLAEVFTAIKSSSEPLPDLKDNKQLKTYFEKVYPNLDFERVYTSDMKKMIKWYEELGKHNVEIKLSEEEAAENNENSESAVQNPDAEADNQPSEVRTEDSRG